MAAQGGEYIYALGLDTKAFEKSAERAKRAFAGMTGEIVDSGDKIDAAMNKIKSSVAALATFATFKELTKKLIEVRGEMQKLAVAYETMLGSKEKADALMSDVVRLAAKTPFGLEDVSNATKMLLAFGSTAEDVAGEINMLGNIASGLSIPLNDLIMLYGTTRTQGQLFTQDLRQFMSRGIPLADELAKQFGVTKDKVGGLVTAGKVGFNDVAIALRSMTSEGGQFYNLMEKQSETLAGQMSNLEDAIYQMFNSIGEQTEGVISGAISSVSSLVENYERVGRVLISLVASYGVYKAAVSIAAMMTKGWTIAEIAHYNALLLADKAQKLLNATMMSNPFVAAAAAIMAVVVALSSMKTEAERLRDATEQYNQTKQEAIDKENEHKRAVEELERIASDESASTDNRKAALHRLIEMYPDVFAQYATEYDMLLNIKRIKEEIARIDGQNSITNKQNQLQQIEQEIAKITGKSGASYYKDAYLDLKDKWWGRVLLGNPVTASTGLAIAGYNAYNTSKDNDAQLQMLLEEQQKLKHELEKEGKISSIANMTMDTIESEKRKLSDVLDSINLAKQRDEKVNLADYGYDGYNIDELKTLSVHYNNEYNKRTQERKTINEIRKDANQAVKDAENAIKDFEKSKAKYTKDEADKRRQELLDDLKAKQDEAKKWAPIGGGKSGKNATAAQKEAAQKAEKEAKLTNQLLAQNRDMSIELMEEGLDKELATIDREYEERIEAIRRHELELLELRKELTDEQQNAISQALSDAEAKRDKDAQRLLNERINAYNDYLAEYGTLKEREVAIGQKYDRLIAEAQAEGDKARVSQLKQERLVAEAAFADEVVKFAGDIEQYSAEKLLDNIYNLQQQVNTVIAEMEAMDSSDSDEYKNAASQLAILQAMIVKANEAYDRLVAPNPQVEQKKKEFNEFVDIANNLSQQFDVVSDIVGEFDATLGDSLKSVSGLASSLVNLAVTMFATQQAADAARRSLTAMEKASVILAAISFALTIVQAGIDGVKRLLNREFDEFEKLKEQYDGISEIWTDLIDKKKEYLGMSFGSESVDAAREAQQLIAEEEKLNRMMAKERTDTRRERKKAVEGMTAGAYQELVEQGLAKDTGGIFIDDRGLIQQNINWDKLLNMTPEELASLRDNAKEFWATMDGDLRTYLENVIATGEKSAEVEEMIRERLTQISFDDLSDSFFDAMMDMDATAEEVANNVSEYFFKAMMMDNMGEAYKQKLNKWYEDFYAAMDDADGLTAEERERLRQDYANIVNEGIAERDAIAEATGYDAALASQQATSKGFQAMSQETGSELNGRFTDIQGQTHRIAEAVEFMQGIQMQQSQYLQSVSSTLASIHNDTSLIAEHTKTLGQIGFDLAMIKRAVANGEI